MRAVLLTLALLLALATPAAAQAPVDEAAAALRDDTVYVDPSTGVDAGAIRSGIEEHGLDVHVAVLPDSADAERAAMRLAEEVGGDVAVIAGTSIVAGPSEAAQRAADEAVDAGQGAGAEAVALDFVDRLGEEQHGGGDGGGAGGLILLGLAGAGGAALLVARRRKRREEAEQFAEVKTNARDDLVALGEDIRALEVDMDMPGVSGGAKTDYETAVHAYDRANRGWETARRPNDLEPVGSALEEGRWAMTSARARLDGHEPPERRSPCFFDPRHGPSSREVEWAPPGGEPRMVPACEADAQRVDRGEDPQSREVTVGGERVPYWSAGPMYAPFMGGFYGVGILPALMVGTLLGSTWDTPADAAGGGDWGGGDFGGGDFGGGGFGGGDFGG